MAGVLFEFLLKFIIFVFVSCRFSQVLSSSCPDGSYKHDGRDCCQCGAGLHLAEHCKTNLTHGKCAICPSGTYTSYANHQTTCDLCTSCSHPNENLEEAEPCTSARDSKCRCQKDHYCVSGTEVCRLCHPCKKCGAEGIKEACKGNSNTVCNEKIQGGNQAGLIAGIIVLIIVLILAGGAVIFWRKKKRQQTHTAVDMINPPGNGNADDVESQRLLDVDVEPLLPDIAKAVGWTVMQDVALRTGTPKTTIESAQLDHPGQSEEQTLKLLMRWVESQGKPAGVKLIETLRKSGRITQAEKVTHILSRGI